MAKRHVPVQATAGIYIDASTPPLDKAARQASQLDNLHRLKAAGVTILIGSDHYGEDATHEADYLQSLGLWSNAEMLRMWAVSTPKDIFPRRQIASFAPGYEASFLVLADNPLEVWSATHTIVDRWKQGHHITLRSEVGEISNNTDAVARVVHEPFLSGKQVRPSSSNSRDQNYKRFASEGKPTLVRASVPILAPGFSQEASAISGKVIGLNGEPISGTEVSRFWVLGTFDHNGARAYGSTLTDLDGRFSLSLSQGDFPIDLIAYSSDRTSAAVIHVSSLAQPLTVSLRPVQRVRVDAEAKPLGGALNGTRFLLQTGAGATLAQLFGNKVEVPFPVGDYQLSLSSADTVGMTKAIHVTRGMPSVLHVTLSLSAMAKHFGKNPPQLAGLVDSKGRPIGPPNFDRPTLLYFWADWCEPCIAEGIPHLLQFTSSHPGDRFQIIAIHENGLPQPSTTAAFQKSLQHLQQSAWKQPLSFPFLFDSTGEVTRAWGLSTFPTYALIDGKGHLQREAGLEQLETIMKAGPRRRTVPHVGEIFP